MAAMTTGDTAPLAAAPSESAVALLVRDAATARAENAASIEATVETALGDRLNDEDKRAVHTAMTDWVHARGDWWAGGLAWGASDPSRGLWARTPAASPDTSARAVRELIDLSHRRAFADMLSGSLHLSPATVRGFDAPPVAKASLALFEEKASGGGPRRPDAGPSPGIAWGVQGEDLFVVAGTSAPQLLSAEAAPHRRVGDDPRAARSLAALGPSASFAVLAEPLRFDPTRSEPDSAAAAAFAWGRKGEGAWARLELADVLLRELLRLRLGSNPCLRGGLGVGSSATNHEVLRARFHFFFRSPPCLPHPGVHAARRRRPAGMRAVEPRRLLARRRRADARGRP
jgi:hypothetical protein